MEYTKKTADELFKEYNITVEEAEELFQKVLDSLKFKFTVPRKKLKNSLIGDFIVEFLNLT